MSLKPFNPHRALAALRRESPSPESAARLRAALARPQARRSLAKPLALAMIPSALALALFFPHAHAGSAWAQTLAATLDAPVARLTQRTPDGRLVMDEWWAGPRRARVRWMEGTGQPIDELREDGRRRYSFFNHRAFRGRTDLNGARYGLLYTPRDQSEGRRFLMGSLEGLLASKAYVVEGHDEADPAKGTPERYQLSYREFRRLRLTVEVDPERRRVRRILMPSFPPTEVEYPERAPTGVFEPRPQTVRDVTVYDLDAQKAVVAKRLREGLGRQGPVTLRLVTLDADGRLWAFWTGAPPSRDLKPPVRLVGLPSGAPFGMRMFTKDWATATTAKGNPHWKPGTPHLGGMALVPTAKVGATVDLDLPYPGGVARFRRVPVLRIADLSHFDRELGVERTYR